MQNNKKFSIKENLEQYNILNYFSKDDVSDLLVQDIIVGENVDIQKEDLMKNNNIESGLETGELNETIDSENEVIELLE